MLFIHIYIYIYIDNIYIDNIYIDNIYIDNILIMTINKDTGVHVYQSEYVIQAVSYKPSVRCDEDELMWVVVPRVEHCAISKFFHWLLL